MRIWTILGRYPVYDDDGKITHTDVTVVSSNQGHATFTERVLGDQRMTIESDVIELVLEAFFKSQYADRAMAESVQTIEELKLWKAEAEKRMADAEADRNTRFKAMEDKFELAMATLDTKVDETVAELTELVTGIVSTLPSMEENLDEASIQ